MLNISIDDRKLLSSGGFNKITEDVKDTLGRVLDTIPERYKNVLLDTYGFYGKELSLTEIADRDGISRERVRQIRDKALRMLRHPSRKNRIERELVEAEHEIQ